MIKIKFFGTYRIFSNGEDITSKFSSKGKALLCYILKHNKNIFSREIWDRVDEGNTEGEISILDKEIHYCLRKIDSLNLKHIHLYY